MAENIDLVFPAQFLNRGKIGVLTLDATVRETHEMRATVTNYVTESGSFISDHKIIEPRRLIMEGEITDSPLEDKQDLIGISRRLAAFEVLEKLHLDKELVTVVTGLKVYPNMLLVAISTQRDSSTGQRLPFTAEFQEFRTVTSRTVGIPKGILAATKKDIGQSTVKRGKQTADPATAPQEAKMSSTLADWLQ